MLHILEWPVAELDDVRVIEMGVGSEERVLGLKLKFIVLIVFSANIAHPDVACKSLQTLQRIAFVDGFSIEYILLISKSLQTLQRFAQGEISP